MKYDKLFEPGKIGSLELKNRFIVGAMGVGFAELGGTPTDRTVAYYEERAKGGFSLIITEVTRVQDSEFCTPFEPSLGDDKHIPAWKKVTDAVHAQGAYIFPQLHQPGRQYTQALLGHQVSAPSPLACPMFDETPHELTTQEVWDNIHMFGDAAVRAKKAGFDGVEIHAGHGYLVQQFLSQYTNRRFDEFGGSLENRARFACEICKEIKEKCGKDFPVIIKLSGEEKVPGGLTISDTKILAKYFEEAGYDAIEVTICTYATLDWMSAPEDEPMGFNAYNAQQIKQGVSIPVISIDRINTPEIAEDILETGKADFVSISRQSLADPEFPNKTKAGKVSEINPCINCLQSCMGYMTDPNHLTACCLVNPRVGHEAEYKFDEADKKKKVAVVGSGPAGLYAAYVMARRGHDVTVYEAQDKMGGQFRVATLPPVKSLLTGPLRFWIQEGKKFGVKYVLNTEVTKELIENEKPDAVVLATGAKQSKPGILGIDNENVFMANDVIEGKVSVGRNVLIAGAGLVGLETADFLRERAGRKSTLIDMVPAVNYGVLGVGTHLQQRLDSNGTQYILSAAIKEFTKDGVVYEQNGEVKTASGFDSIVIAMGSKSYNPLEKELEGLVDEVYVIGDATKAGQANKATEEAAAIAFKI
jgi:2,4-dienoyl-CoA reductase-like NADH-dependent reductase (Old Yellow Enzyme family)/pyruvate/2-oxoglutarate dehydrogenase complex dihydrolipoamide dehydrogenase (E3) component